MGWAWPAVAVLLSAGAARADVVTGRFSYVDSQANPDGGGVTTFERPIAGCLVQVWQSGLLPAATVHTGPDGRFTATVGTVPDNTDTTVLVYAQTDAAYVTGGAGPFFVETAHQRSRGSTTLDFSPPAFTGRNETRSFNAVEDIQLAFDYAAARRDPAEHDEVGTVVVSFVDDESIGTHYNPAPASGLIIHHSDADNDLVILHEYTHFLEDKIGSFLAQPSFHDGCFSSQLCPTPSACPDRLINTPENAWMEGFADYLAMAVMRANPAARLNLSGGGTSTEAMLEGPGGCAAVGHRAIGGQLITGDMVENFVAGALWDLHDQPGDPPPFNAGESFDQLGGQDRMIFQIFDHELDGDHSPLANIGLFRQHWIARGLPSAALDAIYTGNQLPTPPVGTGACHVAGRTSPPWGMALVVGLALVVRARRPGMRRRIHDLTR
jgi:hypothetical protein